MGQSAKLKTKQTPTVAEAPPTVATKRRKVLKPGSAGTRTLGKESPATGREHTSMKNAAATKPDAVQSQSRPSTKKGQLIAMLSTKSGTDVASISAALGWQPHTTRAALTMLRKAGYTIEAAKPAGGGAGLYRIVAHPAARSAA